MITVGFDPEVFWRNEEGKLISVIGKLGGTKSAPRKVDELVHVLEDNVAAEFNSPPVTDVDNFIKAIDSNLAYLRSQAKSMGFDLADHVSSGMFDIDQLQDPAAFVFGCEPDYNAWTGEVNMPPQGVSPFLRSCGGHIHVGFEGIDKDAVVRALDLFIGVPSVFLDPDTQRKFLYGKAGACRYKPYGVEYRTASNWWIWKKENVKWVWDRVHKAVEFARKTTIDPESNLGGLIQGAINHNHQGYAKSVFSLYPEVRL